MEIERVFYPLKTLGYGNRVGIWTVGCLHNCFNCCNPELQPIDKTKNISMEQIFYMIDSVEGPIDGVTISGGDPFLQPEELSILIDWLIKKGISDILVFSGYTLDELLRWNNHYVDSALNNIACLIDGKYVEALNDNLSLRGSSNQRVLVLNEKYIERYENLLGNDRKLQNVYFKNDIVTFGIPPKDFKQDVQTQSYKKGIKIT